MGWFFHDLFKAVRGILVYTPSIFFSRCVVKAQETTIKKDGLHCCSKEVSFQDVWKVRLPYLVQFI